MVLRRINIIAIGVCRDSWNPVNGFEKDQYIIIANVWRDSWNPVHIIVLELVK